MEGTLRREISLVLFRSVSPRYASEDDLLSGEGSFRHGGRWNPPGVRAVYGSFSPETALSEALAGVRHYGIPVEKALPRVMAAFKVKSRELPDLTNPETESALGVSMQAIREEDWRAQPGKRTETLGQAIGRAAAASGLHGLVVPSFADTQGTNALFFPQDGDTGPTLHAVNAGELPEKAKMHAKMLALREAGEEKEPQEETARAEQQHPPGKEATMKPTTGKEKNKRQPYPIQDEEPGAYLVAEAAEDYATSGPRIEPIHPAPRLEIATQGGRSTLALRAQLRMTRPRFLRLFSLSERAFADIEAGKKAPGEAFKRQLEEVTRLVEALEDIMEPDAIGPWLETPNQAFEGHKPMELIERGEIDRLWEMVFHLRAGLPV